MSVIVGRPGMLTTVQDRGRFGWQHAGVPVAGPMDWWSHEAANRMVGNDPQAATLEITLIGPELELGRDAIFTVVGAEFELDVSGRAAVMNRAFEVAAGERLSFGRRLSGARAYVAVDGGFDTTPALGSRATHVTAGLGGPDGTGRALRRGDVVPLGTPRPRGAATPAAAVPPHMPAPSPVVLRAIPGPEPAPAAFWDASFTISPRSDRMGYRLEGATLATPGDHLSSAVAMGTVQATPSGTCILLMADRATTGGYARVATVITADLPRAGQLAPGDAVRFVAAAFDDAAAALHSMRAQLPAGLA